MVGVLVALVRLVDLLLARPAVDRSGLALETFRGDRLLAGITDAIGAFVELRDRPFDTGEHDLGTLELHLLWGQIDVERVARVIRTHSIVHGKRVTQCLLRPSDRDLEFLLQALERCEKLLYLLRSQIDAGLVSWLNLRVEHGKSFPKVVGLSTTPANAISPPAPQTPRRRLGSEALSWGPSPHSKDLTRFA